MKSSRFGVTAGVLLTVALFASGCGSNVLVAGGQADVADPAPIDCLPPLAVPVSPSQQDGIKSYYAVVMQLANCQAQDIPLSIDLDLNAGTGTSLKAAGGIDAVGTSVVWDNGTGTAQNGPQPTVPQGNGAGGYGPTVGFTTVPHWNGTRADSPGPYDASEGKDSHGNPAILPNFSGGWTVYGPSSAIELQVFTSLPWAYTPEYFESGNLSQDPGAIATGVMMVRTQLGDGAQIPIYLKSSGQGYGSSPPADSFVPGACWDPLVLVDGGAPPQTGLSASSSSPSLSPVGVQTDWSFLGQDSGPPPLQWWFTAAGNDFEPLSEQFPAAPPVLLGSAELDTDSGDNAEIPLRSDTNSVQSLSPHYVKAYYRVMQNIKCSGSDQSADGVVIGGDLSGINFASAEAESAVFANTNLSGANLNSATFIGPISDRGRPEVLNFAYSDLSDSSGTPTDLSSASLVNANLTGAKLNNAIINSTLTLTGSSLLMTDLSGISVDDWNNNVSQANTKFCQTIQPGDTEPTNSDCDALIRDQDLPWNQVDTADCSAGSCIFVSIYNNSTRTLARGFSQCLEGEPRSFESDVPVEPAFISPLDTVSWRWGLQAGQDPDANKNLINCGITFANGASGKIRVTATSDDKTPKLTVDEGYCAKANACLPRSADGSTPVVVNVNQDTSRIDGSFYNIVVCDASAATNGTCPTTAALPGLQPVATSSKDRHTKTEVE